MICDALFLIRHLIYQCSIFVLQCQKTDCSPVMFLRASELLANDTGMKTALTAALNTNRSVQQNKQQIWASTWCAASPIGRAEVPNTSSGFTGHPPSLSLHWDGLETKIFWKPPVRTCKNPFICLATLKNSAWWTPILYFTLQMILFKATWSVWFDQLMHFLETRPRNLPCFTALIQK